MTAIYCPPGLLRATYSKQVQAYSLGHFRKIVNWASSNHPFYRQHIPQPNQHVPIFSRAIIQQNNERLLNGHEVTSRTSGSSGMPLQIAHSPDRVKFNRGQNAKILGMIGIDFAKSVSIVFAAQHENKNNVLDIHTSFAEQVAFIKQKYRDEAANILISYPSNLLELARYIREGGDDLSFVNCLVGISEAMDEGDEAAIKIGFPGARIWSNYSASEFGMIAFRCPFEPAFHHTVAEKLGVEILNDQDEPCAENEIGRMVITDYFGDWMPFIRYDIGDLAAPAVCPCGKLPVPAIHQLAGKVRGMLKKPDGTPVMFVALSAALRDLPGLGQYQVIQDGLTEFTLRYVLTNTGHASAVEQRATELFQAHWGYAPQLTFVQEAHIEKSPNGKFFASVCNV